ncbi:MAG: hypothetical protein IRZ14_04670 [Chloroflexi bacterium]|nr:hypothetical protein [Chloroflexota bacterium]
MADLIGVRTRRYGPVRFARADRPLPVGEPALVDGPDGPLPARVVVAAEQLVYGATHAAAIGRAVPAAPAAWRTLPTTTAREQAALATIEAWLAQRDEPVEITAVVYDPLRESLTVRCAAPGVLDAESLARELESVLGLHVELRPAAPPPRTALGALAAAALARGCSDAAGGSAETWGATAALLARLSARNRAFLEQRERLPRLGQAVEIGGTAGRVSAVDVATQRVTVRLADGQERDYLGPDLTPAPPPAPRERRRVHPEQ